MPLRTFEGSDLEKLRRQVKAEMGPGARIVRAGKVRRGGVAGFFCREFYQVEAEAPAEAQGGRRSDAARAEGYVEAAAEAVADVVEIAFADQLRLAEVAQGTPPVRDGQGQRTRGTQGVKGMQMAQGTQGVKGAQVALGTQQGIQQGIQGMQDPESPQSNALVRSRLPVLAGSPTSQCRGRLMPNLDTELAAPPGPALGQGLHSEDPTAVVVVVGEAVDLEVEAATLAAAVGAGRRGIRRLAPITASERPPANKRADGASAAPAAMRASSCASSPVVVPAALQRLAATVARRRLRGEPTVVALELRRWGLGLPWVAWLAHALRADRVVAAVPAWVKAEDLARWSTEAGGFSAVVLTAASASVATTAVVTGLRILAGDKDSRPRAARPSGRDGEER